MAERQDESSKLERWAGLRFEGVAGEIWAVDAGGKTERAPEFQAVVEVLRGIPDLPDRADEIRQAAFNICSVAMLAGWNDQPNARENRGGTEKDLDELQELHELCRGLVYYLYHMHQASRGALEKQDHRGLRKFIKEVGRWSDLAGKAWDELKASEPRPSRRGRPTKVTKAAIRTVALREYELLRGRPAARKGANYGPLTTFFEDLFSALGLNPAGAARQARQAIEERDAALAENPL